MVKALQVAKVGWMLFWRLAIAEALFIGKPSFLPFLIALTGALVLVLVAGRTIKTFPIIRRLMGREVAPELDADQNQPPASSPPQAGRGSRGASTLNYPGPPRNTPPPQTGPSHVSPGGSFEHSPRVLEAIPEPSVKQMFGRPGRSLSSAKGISAANAASGALGEKNFAKSLATEGLLTRCTSLWSVKMPSKFGFTPDPVLNTDIDCMLFYGDKVLLLDMKLYTGGDITYRNSGDKLVRIDNKTGVVSGAPVNMSKNMQIAQERFAKLCPNSTVYAMVVFMPTDRGSATLDGVMWPGAIPAVNLNEMLQYLSSALPASSSISSEARSILPLLA